MKFNDWLLTEIKKRGWSQAELARQSGLTRAAISNYIAGQSPNGEAIDKLAKAFKMPPSVLFEISSSKKTATDPWVEEIAHKLSLLDESRKTIAHKLLKALLDEQEDNHSQNEEKLVK